MEKKQNWKKYLIEFISIFVAVISAFALDNWNENRKNDEAATKILIEVSNGLQRDLEDININMYGHRKGIQACVYWRKVISNQEFNKDSLKQYYLGLTRDFFSAQNSSGYETLKSTGLELIKNDSLRFDIISLYEYDYQSLKTMEENYFEMQFQENYFKDFNSIIAPNFEFDEKGDMARIKTPLNISPDKQKILMAYLWKIQVNRTFILRYYATMESKIEHISQRIDQHIKKPPK
ncbi:MAG: hypothetical protein MRZ79_13775 [Bacteroidia bacterium]|nr:hypothetical protein [Bacteroidia bacterium]